MQIEHNPVDIGFGLLALPATRLHFRAAQPYLSAFIQPVRKWRMYCDFTHLTSSYKQGGLTLNKFLDSLRLVAL